MGDLLLLRLACLPVLIDAFRATGLPGYGGLPAIPAEACVFQFAACLNCACPTKFLPFLGGKADSLWLLGSFRLCGVVACFDTLLAGVRAAAVLPGFLVLRLGSGSWS